MANLKQEYRDSKNVKHSVEHLPVSGQENADRERLIAELLAVLAQPGRDFSP